MQNKYPQQYFNDAQRLSTDPTFRLIGSPKRWDRSAALNSTLHWFDRVTDPRGEPRRVDGREPRRDCAGRDVEPIRSHGARHDSSENQVDGEQEGSGYNGHFESVCYHRCFSSTTTATAWPRSCARGTDPARTTGRTCLCPRSTASRPWHSGWRSGPTPLRTEGDLRCAGGPRRGLRHSHPGHKNLELPIEDILFRSPCRPSRKPLIRSKELPVSGGQLSEIRKCEESHQDQPAKVRMLVVVMLFTSLSRQWRRSV